VDPAYVKAARNSIASRAWSLRQPTALPQSCQMAPLRLTWTTRWRRMCRRPILAAVLHTSGGSVWISSSLPSICLRQVSFYWRGEQAAPGARRTRKFPAHYTFLYRRSGWGPIGHLLDADDKWAPIYGVEQDRNRAGASRRTCSLALDPVWRIPCRPSIWCWLACLEARKSIGATKRRLHDITRVPAEENIILLELCYGQLTVHRVNKR
jgi:hypothetical protein